MGHCQSTSAIPHEINIQKRVRKHKKIETSITSSSFNDLKVPFDEDVIVCDNFIGNEFISPIKNNYVDVICPRNNTIIGKVCKSCEEDINKAVNIGSKAYNKWSKYTIRKRISYLHKIKLLLELNKNTLAYIIMLEHGKTFKESIMAINKGIESIVYAMGLASLSCGKILEVSNNIDCHYVRKSHGICVTILPYNFPMMVLLMMFGLCISLGNVIIFKPSIKVPLSVNYFCKLLQLSELPKGVIQIINGSRNTVNKLIDNKYIKNVSFIGSSKVADIVYKRCSNLTPPKQCLALGAAKNHLIVNNDCDIDVTSNDILHSFLGSAGQTCMATSVVLLIGKQDKLINTLIKKCKFIKPDIINDLKIFKKLSYKEKMISNKYSIGPINNKNLLNSILNYINIAEKNNDNILIDGRKWSKKYNLSDNSNYMGPTIILHNNKNNILMKEEIFGPVLSIYVCKDKQEAIEIENNCRFGNASSIYTKSGQVAKWFTKRFTSGMVGVNISIPIPRDPFSFGGSKDSKYGSNDINCEGGIEFFTWKQKITTKWSVPE